MVRINPDPHTGGYVYIPTSAVTALFPAGQSTDAVLRALSQAGFDGERIDVFTGEDGANRMDAEGKTHGLWVRFRRSLEDMFADDADVFHRADHTLRTGGSMVEVFIHGDKALMQKAGELLKAHGGRDVIYWGRFVTEYL